MSPAPLPIDPHLERIRQVVRAARAAIVVAAPGAGKTTRVPPVLAVDGPTIVLQPRRLAARAIARRIAEEQGWTPGDEVGWQVRFERRFTSGTRVLLATEGILTARLQQDPLASDFRTIVLDEFHERSIHADLGLALARQAWLARDDLRLVVMSATLDPGPIRAFLHGCPVIDVAGTSHPLAIEYAPGQPVSDAVRELAPASHGQVLCFLAGAPEIRRAADDLARVAPHVEVVALHGSLSSEDQDRALVPPARAGRVVLATNIAETSLTVPGVDTVIDTGLHKVARYDAARGIDSLVTERVPLDSADQRAGRAARLGPGRVRRLWDARDRLRRHRDPDIARIDMAGPLLDVLAWGGDLERFEWFEAPSAASRTAAVLLLQQLGALADGHLTVLGHQLQRLPVHPRLARILIEARAAPEAAAICATLSERNLLPARHAATTCDLLSVVDEWRNAPGHVRQVARSLEDLASRVVGARRNGPIGERDLRHAIFQGYGDRLARRRESRGDRLLLASGTGAVLAAESGVRDGDWLVALDVQQVAGRPAGTDTVVRLASRVEPEWIVPDAIDREHFFDAPSGRVRAVRRERVGALVISEHAVDVDPEVRATLLAEACRTRGWREADRTLFTRLRFAGLRFDDSDLLSRASVTARTLDDIDLEAQLDHGTRRDLDRLAPPSLLVPSGRRVPLSYHDDGSVSAAVKLQELFGLGETPAIGPRQVPVLFHLLAPNGRPVQMTRDLRSFWTRTYPEVRKELRGRYPKHPWPDDPWTATPTARPARAKRLP